MKANRLVKEKSPYLLQHAHNPVEWYPWGQEAFNDALKYEKPIFLSIGYATCHWCHVMEKECFEDADLARLMNDTFINIKVDREELPEVDGIYMEFAQGMMTGSAGWPLNIILTSDLKPFFAATYLPPEGKHGLIGLKDLVLKIKSMWDSEERDVVIEQAQKIVEMFEKNLHVKGDDLPDKEYVDEAAEFLFKMADPIYGGMKGAPKFPVGYQINFMLRYYMTSKEARARFLVERTLDMMHRGGIYDHLGGGYSRYSTDEMWLVPHFEKMLYDNALLSFSYLECWQVTKKAIYKEICIEILEYLLREMKSPDGAFYSAVDADSEGQEGRFYTWTLAEFQNILGQDESAVISEYFDMTQKGNFFGRNVLHTPFNLEEFAKNKKLSLKKLSAKIKEQKELLFRLRESREHPFKDDKILTAWNGLAIFSFLEAGLTFGEKRYIDAALNAATFIKNKMWIDGTLFRRFRDGDVRFKAGLDEYAMMIRACISLFEGNLGVSWLQWAIEMSHILEQDFKEPQGAFYQTEANEEHLLLRKCQFSDGAEPSGNAIHTENLLRLYQLTNESSYLEQAEDCFAAVKKYLENYSPGYSYHSMNLNRYFDKKAPTLVIAFNEKKSYEAELKEQIYNNFIPHKVIIWKSADERELLELIPYLDSMIPIEGKTTLYICFEGSCREPLNELTKMMEAIHKL